MIAKSPVAPETIIATVWKLKLPTMGWIATQCQFEFEESKLIFRTWATHIWNIANMLRRFGVIVTHLFFSSETSKLLLERLIIEAVMLQIVGD